MKGILVVLGAFLLIYGLFRGVTDLIKFFVVSKDKGEKK